MYCLFREVKRGGEDEWEMTPVTASGQPRGGTHGAGTGRTGGYRSSMGSGGGWGASDTPLPAAAMPRGAATAGAGASAARSVGRVKFDVAPSPALTPSWKSTSWSKKEAGAVPGTMRKVCWDEAQEACDGRSDVIHLHVPPLCWP